MPDQDKYYGELLDSLTAGKDSILEMAKILSYDSKEVKATVFTLTSQQTKKDVPVFFNSQFGNKGAFFPPAINSVSLLYWGPDKEAFLLPIQLTVPATKVNEQKKLEFDVNPGVNDENLNIENIEGGEISLRSLGGASGTFKNCGDIELATDLFHRILIDRNLGEMQLFFDRLRDQIGTYEKYTGPIDDKALSENRFQMKEKIFEESKFESLLPNMSDNDFISAVESGTIPLLNPTPIFEKEGVHVLDEAGILKRMYGIPLFFETIFRKDLVTQVTKQNKEAQTKIETTKLNKTAIFEDDYEKASLDISEDDKKTRIDVNKDEVNIKLIDGVKESTVNFKSNDITINHHSGTSFSIKDNGDVEIDAKNNILLSGEKVLITERSGG